MLEKRKHDLDNPDIIITRRHIGFVTAYSVDDCINQLQSLAQETTNTVELSIHLNDDKPTSFEIKSNTGRRIGGTLQLQDDGICLVQAKVSELHDEVMVALIVTIILLVCAFLVSIEGFLPLAVFSLLATLMISIFYQSKSDIPSLHNLLIQTLYMPLDINEKLKHA